MNFSDVGNSLGYHNESADNKAQKVLITYKYRQ